MRRAALAAACVALAAALLAPSAGGALTGTPGGRHFAPMRGELATTHCVAWKKHRKRVAKYVVRQGERRKVVRVKRWRTCARRAAVPPATVAPIPAAPQPEAEPEDPTIPRLGVKAEDKDVFRYTLSRETVPAGDVVVELNNQGEDPHNLNLERTEGGGPDLSLPTVGPDEQARAKFALAAGEYRLWCSLDGHEAAGMKATLIVAAD